MFVLSLLTTLALATEYQQLHSDRAEATSFLKSSWNKYNENYHPNYVLDNNPATAWVEGVAGNGEGERILIPISSVAKIKSIKLRIRNGYQKSPKLLMANAAPNDIQIDVTNRNGQMLGQHNVALTKTMGWQEIIIPIDSEQSAQVVSLKVLSTHAGNKYKDTCISDIEILVFSETPYNEQAELLKKSNLEQWTKERLKQAVYFANQPKQYPFSETKVLDYDHLDLTDEQENQRLIVKMNKLDEDLATLAKQPIWYTRESTNELEFTPDGLWELNEYTDIWDLSSLSLFETTKQFDTYIKNSPTEGAYRQEYVERFLSNFKLQRRKDGSVEYLYFTDHIVQEERTLYGSDSTILCTYNKQGRLVSIYDKSSGFDNEMTMYLGEDGSESVRRLYTFTYDQNNKIQEITRVEWSESIHVNSTEVFFQVVEEGYVEPMYYEDLPDKDKEEMQKKIGQELRLNRFEQRKYSFSRAISYKK